MSDPRMREIMLHNIHAQSGLGGGYMQDGTYGGMMAGLVLPSRKGAARQLRMMGVKHKKASALDKKIKAEVRRHIAHLGYSYPGLAADEIGREWDYELDHAGDQEIAMHYLRAPRARTEKQIAAFAAARAKRGPRAPAKARAPTKKQLLARLAALEGHGMMVR